MKKFLCFILCLIVSFSFIGCNSSSNSRIESNSMMDNWDKTNPSGYAGASQNVNRKSVDDEVALNEAEPEAVSDETKAEEEPAEKPNTDEIQKDKKAETKEDKLVYTCNMVIETTDYKETMSDINKVIQKYSGIIDNENEYDEDYNWYETGHTKTKGTMNCSMTVRIPSKDYKNFLNDLDGNGKITNKTMNVENISRTYYDTAATIESLKIQEQRVLKMMEEAKSIDEMIKVESRLTEIQSELNRYQTQLSIMDTDVAYSTVNLTIKEVLEYKETIAGKKTNKFSDRLMNTLEESWASFLSIMESILFSLIYLVPFALLFALIWILITPFRRRYKKNAEKKRKEFKEKYRKKYQTEKKEDDSSES